MHPSNFIRIPLFKLHHIRNVDDFSGFTKEEWALASKDYSKEELSEIKESIKWAVRNKDFDFASLLPSINFTNDQIYEFFCKLNKSIPE